MSGQERGAPGLMRQCLSWVAMRPRSYSETMDAWRTSCPRLSVWEDALEEGLVVQEAADDARQAAVRVVLTAEGRARLDA